MTSSQPPNRPPLAEALDLAAHPEGGWYRETWRATTRFTPQGYEGHRASASAIYFLLEPGEESQWHQLRAEEMWLWHDGGPLFLMLGGTGERPGGNPSIVTLGSRVELKHVPQALVPAGTWQSARPAENEEVLVSCVVSPGFDFADFRMWRQ